MRIGVTIRVPSAVQLIEWDKFFYSINFLNYKWHYAIVKPTVWAKSRVTSAENKIVLNRDRTFFIFIINNLSTKEDADSIMDGAPGPHT